MIFGLFKGKVELQLAKMNFAPGEMIEGTLVMSLKKPVKAKQLLFSLIGEETKSERQSDGTMKPETHVVFQNDVVLDGEKEYPGGDNSYKFSLKIDENVLKRSEVPAEGMVGSILKVAKYMSMGSSFVLWYVQGRLDVPMGFDVSKKVKISVTQ
ncbi:MAG TPA: hypothetical protein VJ201_02400 [Candidatus Babeliales bacterium]|nr:hypothetical protein [Candidatus Babeliales bacterium]